jgi:hypothetical protein
MDRDGGGGPNGTPDAVSTFIEEGLETAGEQSQAADRVTSKAALSQVADRVTSKAALSESEIKGKHQDSSPAKSKKFKNHNNNFLKTAFSQAKQLTFPVRQSGNITAVVFWFDMTLSPGVSASTIDPHMHWHHTACVLDERRVEAGEVITVNAQLEKSYLHFSIAENC